MKISRYLSPQIYKSIFSGEKDVTIHTERKKLTIFFSDIKDFTATTERLQPEEITALLNEYFTEMSQHRAAHGGTVDKFIGDAMLIFFGDPETKGDAEDARACLRMALEMQQRLAELNAEMAQRRHRAAVPRPHGHQTGYLQRRQFRQRRPHGLHDHRRRGEPRGAPAIDRRARARSSSATRPTRWCATSWWRRRCRRSRMKGISREVVPYAVEGMLDKRGEEHRDLQRAHDRARPLSRSADGRCRPCRSRRAVLQSALEALERKS